MTPTIDPPDGGAITDGAHWEHAWSNVGSARKIPSWHGNLGRNGAFLRLLRRHVRPATIDRARVMEIGGGGSTRLVALALWAGCEATALDYSPAGLEALRRLAEINGVNVERVLADMFTYTPERPFDLVTHWGLLEHFERPSDVMAVCARLVRPGGVVAFGMPNMAAVGAKLWRQKNPRSWALHIFHSDEVVRQACADAGLELRRVFHWGVPLIKQHWHSDETWTRLLGFAQLGMFGVAKFLPLFQWGAPAISAERAFIAVRPE